MTTRTAPRAAFKRSSVGKRAKPSKRTSLARATGLAKATGLARAAGRLNPSASSKPTPQEDEIDIKALTKLAHESDARHIAAAMPPPAPPPLPLDPKLMARNIREVGPAAALYSCMSSFYSGQLELAAYKEMIDGVLRDLGDPKDPTVRMLAEQIILTHHVTGRLQARAANQEKAEGMEIYLRGATKMMAEFRKHLELFTRLRTSASPIPHPPIQPESHGEPQKSGHTELVSNARKRVARAA
jgi:hypothetical protein